MDNKWPVCNLEVPEPKYYKHNETGMHMYSCPRCGEYDIATSFEEELSNVLKKDNKKMATLSHWVRLKHESIMKEAPTEGYHKNPIKLDLELVKSIIKSPPPNPTEQADNFIRWIGDNVKSAGEYIPVDKYSVPAIIGSATLDEFYFVFQHLKDTKGLVKHKSSVGRGNIDLFDITLSFKGCEYYRKPKIVPAE